MQAKGQEVSQVSCSNIGYVTHTLPAGTFRSIYRPSNPSDSQKADAVDDLLTKIGWPADPGLCTGTCTDPTKECRCTGLSSLDGGDDANLTVEEETDGTSYYKMLVATVNFPFVATENRTL